MHKAFIESNGFFTPKFYVGDYHEENKFSIDFRILHNSKHKINFTFFLSPKIDIHEKRENFNISYDRKFDSKTGEINILSKTPEIVERDDNLPFTDELPDDLQSFLNEEFGNIDNPFLEENTTT